MAAEPPRSVPLEQYAAVMAAGGDAHPLEAILRVEGIDPLEWSEERLWWSTRLADDPALFRRYCHALEAAEDRLDRHVAPLGDDLEAWVAFLRCWMDAGEPVDLMAELGLTMNDLRRLQRRWTDRMIDEPKLAQRGAKAEARCTRRADKGERPELPRLTLGAAVLRPSPYARGATAGVAPRPDDNDDNGDATPFVLGLDGLAELQLDLDRRNEQRAQVFARHGLTSVAMGEVVLDVWQRRLAESHLLRADFRRLCSHFEQRARIAARAERSAPPPPRAPTSPQWPGPPALTPAGAALDTTGDLLPALVAGPALPFADDDVDATRGIGVLIVDEESILPFRESTASPPVAGTWATDLPAVPHPAIGLTGEVRVLTDPVLPFDTSPSPSGLTLPRLAELCEHLRLEAIEEAPPPSTDVGGTPASGDGLPLSMAALAALCTELSFQALDVDDEAPRSDEAPVGDVSAAGEATDVTRAVPVFDEEVDTTSAFVAIPDETPPALAALEVSVLDTTSAFFAIDEAAPAPSAPELTLEQYASLRAELGVGMADERTLLWRYGVTDRVALDAHYRACFDAAPELRQRYRALLESYSRWLTRRA